MFSREMAPCLDVFTVYYIVRQFDAGVLPDQIFRALQSSGREEFVPLDDIKACLRHNGRGEINYHQVTMDALHFHQEFSRASRSQTNLSSSDNAYTDSQAYATTAATAPCPTYAHQHGSGLHTGPRGASMPYTSYGQQRHPGPTQASTNNSSYASSCRPWDVQASQVITTAFENCLSVKETVDWLVSLGYAVTASEVNSCLNARGLGTIRVR